MRPAVTVARLMPSPWNTIPFFAFPCIAPLAAARASPLRYHPAAVSPCGWATSGTSIGGTGWAAGPAGAVSRTLPLQAASRVARQASGTARICWAPVDGPCIMQRSCCRLGVEGIVISPFGSRRACPGELCARMAPGLHAPVAVRHHAVERARVVVEDQRQELAVALPHRQFVQAVDRDPLQRAFRVALQRRAGERSHHEHESEPVLAVLAEAGPADRAAQRQRGARSEEHTSELQSLMRNSYAVFCLKKKRRKTQTTPRMQ